MKAMPKGQDIREVTGRLEWFAEYWGCFEKWAVPFFERRGLHVLPLLSRSVRGA